jgi:hypothetical protein
MIGSDYERTHPDLNEAVKKESPLPVLYLRMYRSFGGIWDHVN